MTPIITLFWFTVRQTVLQRRFWASILLAAAPSGVALAIRFLANQPPTQAWETYHEFQQVMLLFGAVPLICMLHGPAVLVAEAQAGTLVYLTVRRLNRATVVVTRFVAIAAVVSLLTCLMMTCLHYSIRLPPAGEGTLLPTGLPVYLRVAPFAVYAYLAIFTTISLVISRSLVVSGIYIVISEVLVANLPIVARIYTVSHQVRRSLTGAIPGLRDVYHNLSPDLAAKLYPDGGSGAINLVTVVVVLVALSCLVATWRELMPARLAQD